MTSLVVVLLALGEAGGAGRVEGVLQDPAARVAELAPELEAKEVARVFRAIERLAELGAAAAPLLESRAPSAPERARPYLRIAAEQARRSDGLPDAGRSRRFTIQYPAQDLGLLLQDFQRRTGARFSLEGFAEALPEVAVEIKDATFAESLQAIARAAKMTPRRESGRYSLQPAPVELPMFAYGGYLMFLDAFTQKRVVDFRGPPRTRITLDLEVIWDPSLRLVSAGSAVVTDAADDQGGALTPAPSEAEPRDGQAVDHEEFLTEGLSSIELVGPARGVEKIAFIRGYVPLQIEKTSVPLVLSNPAADATVKAGGFELAVRKFRAEEQVLEMTLSCPGRKAQEWQTMPLKVTVQDLSGETASASVLVDRGEETLGLKLYCELFQGPGALPRAATSRISKIEVSVATECIERRVPFEFRDLKLR